MNADPRIGLIGVILLLSSGCGEPVEDGAVVEQSVHTSSTRAAVTTAVTSTGESNRSPHAEAPVDDETTTSSSTSAPRKTVWPSADELGACPDTLIDMGAASPAWLISLAASVYEIDGFEATGDASRQEDALWTDPVVVTTLRGPGASPPVLLLESNLVKANAEKQRGAAIFLGVGANDRIVFVVSARPDSEIVFLGECTAPDSARLRAYVSSLVAAGEPVTAEDVFRAVVADPQGEVAADLDAFFTAPSPTGWENRDPDLRLLDPEETPAEILATLDHVAIEIDLPEGWREFPGTICTRASLAWNECTPFEVIPGEPLELLAYAVPGEDLEIWLLDDSATLADPLARLGVVPTDAIAEVVSAAGRPDASIRMHGDPSVAAYDELLSRSASGTPSILLDS